MNIRATPSAILGLVNSFPAAFSCHHISSLYISGTELLLVSGGYTAAKCVLLLFRAPCKKTMTEQYYNGLKNSIFNNSPFFEESHLRIFFTMRRTKTVRLSLIKHHLSRPSEQAGKRKNNNAKFW